MKIGRNLAIVGMAMLGVILVRTAEFGWKTFQEYRVHQKWVAASPALFKYGDMIRASEQADQEVDDFNKHRAYAIACDLAKKDLAASTAQPSADTQWLYNDGLMCKSTEVHGADLAKGVANAVKIACENLVYNVSSPLMLGSDDIYRPDYEQAYGDIEGASSYLFGAYESVTKIKQEFCPEYVPPKLDKEGRPIEGGLSFCNFSRS